MNSKIRTRFAPSPTGFMHIGNFRSALYDYLFAKKNSGTFILRIEDTDKKRFVEGALESLLTVLNWADLNYDEGVFQTAAINDDKTTVVQSEKYPGVIEIGEFGPYIQSEKLETYKKYAAKLVQDGHAYYCFCEPERLDALRKKQQEEKQPPMYDRYCLHNLSEAEVNKKLKENCPYTIRLKMPREEIIEFDDMVRGNVKFNANLVDDQVILKSDGFPTYHLANVVDDHSMNITHVIRGEEWLSSTPKHLILYRNFGWEPPVFAHLPLLLNPDKSKLSKRQGDVAVEDYIKKGYLKEAIINFVAFLGWNPGKGSTQEIFTLEELVQHFELENVHKAGAVFDLKKLDWINAQWIKKLSLDDLYNRAKEFFEQKDFYQQAPEAKKTETYLKKVLQVERDRLSKLSEVGEANQFLFQDLSYDKELLRWKDMDDTALKNSLLAAKTILEQILEKDWEIGELEKALLPAAGEKRGELLWPLRVALTGAQRSPSPFEVAWILGQKETLTRIDDALAMV